MTKKEYIIYILTRLKADWDLAPGLLVLLQNNKLDPQIIDRLTSVFQTSIKQVNDAKLKGRLGNSLKFLESLKSKEGLTKDKERSELKKLEGLLKDI